MNRFKYYWQFDGKAFAFYVVEIEPGVFSDLSGETMLARGIPLPLTPSFETWKQVVYSRRRCGQCYGRLDGTMETLTAHVEACHTLPQKRASNG